MTQTKTDLLKTLLLRETGATLQDICDVTGWQAHWARAALIRRLALSLNRIQEGGVWDTDELRLELGELVALEEEDEIPGFEVAEIEAILLGGEDTTSDPADDLPGPDGPVVSRPGDVWRLGEHLIICGSAREAAMYDRLLDSAAVDVVWTDPPYNVKISGHVRARDQGFAEASGEMSRAEFTTFLGDTLGAAVDRLKPGGVLFACMDWRHIAEMSAALYAIGLEMLRYLARSSAM